MIHLLERLTHSLPHAHKTKETSLWKEVKLMAGPISLYIITGILQKVMIMASNSSSQNSNIGGKEPVWIKESV